MKFSIYLKRCVFVMRVNGHIYFVTGDNFFNDDDDDDDWCFKSLSTLFMPYCDDSRMIKKGSVQ